MPPVGLNVRRLADRSSGERVTRYHPETGEKYLLNPATGQAEPWPTLGWVPEGDLPQEAIIPTSTLEEWVKAGFATAEGSVMVVRPGGPESDPWRVDPDKGIPHTFRHATAIVLHFMQPTGDVRYLVAENPDKWHGGPEGADVAGDPTAEVRNYYLATLEG